MVLVPSLLLLESEFRELRIVAVFGDEQALSGVCFGDDGKEVVGETGRRTF